MFSYLALAVLVVYLGCVGGLLQEALVIFFQFQRTWRTIYVGSFFGVLMTATLAGLSIVFLHSLTPVAVLVIGLVVLGGSYGLSRWAYSYDLPGPDQKRVSMKQFQCAKCQTGLLVAYVLLVGLAFYLLWASHCGDPILTPWQTINRAYIYVFALATFVLGLLIVLRLKSSWVLALVMVHSFLLYSYLPITHDYLYGADGWRHMGVEAQYLSGKPPQKILISDAAPKTQLVEKMGLFAYSQLWGLTVLVAQVTSFGLLEINRWLMPILWALFLPPLLFEIGRSFGFGRRSAVSFAWLSFLPFAWQAGGAFTLPVNLGFLFYLGSLLLIFKRAEEQNTRQTIMILGVGVLLSFGYTLFTVLFWLTFFLFEFIIWRQDFNWIEVFLMVILIGVSLPAAEWVFGYGGMIPNVSLWEGLKQMGGTLTSYYLASGPRPHDISAGNILINEVPSYAFVANALTASRWWLFMFVLGFWFFVAFGLYKMYKSGFESLPDVPGEPIKNPQRNHYCLIFVLTLGFSIAYILSRYWLPGDHLLTRRLESTLAFFLLAALIYGVGRLHYKRSAILGGVLLVSMAVAASYSLGPDTKTVSASEYAAMKYVAAEETGKDKHCVIGTTYPLLALEAISNNSIIGGGFPISSNFEQPDLNAILRSKDVSILDVRRALQATGAASCWILAETGQRMSYYILQGNVTSTSFGPVTVWRYKK